MACVSGRQTTKGIQRVGLRHSVKLLKEFKVGNYVLLSNY